MRSLVEGARLGERVQSFHVGDIRERLLVPTEFFENVRKEEILPRLIGLARERTSLDGVGIFEPALADAQPGDGVQSLCVIHIEPAGEAKTADRFFGFSLFGKKAALRDGRLVMPPVVLHKLAHDLQRSLGPLGLAENFRFKTDDLPNAGIISPGLVETASAERSSPFACCMCARFNAATHVCG